MRYAACLLLVAAACNGVPTADLGPADLGALDESVLAGDADHDGLVDTEEDQLASTYRPFLSVAPDDACPTNGLVVRVTPIDPAPLIALRYAWLFDRSCTAVVGPGAGGSLVVIIDPRVPPPLGLVSLRTIARRNTGCQRISTCGICAGEQLCDTLGGLPAVWASRDLHALFLDRSTNCVQTGACMTSCEDASASAQPPIVNVGEPEAPRVHDLTDAGFIRPEQGWSSVELLHYDPWGGAPFGALPSVAMMLTQAVSDPPVCASPGS